MIACNKTKTAFGLVPEAEDGKRIYFTKYGLGQTETSGGK